MIESPNVTSFSEDEVERALIGPFSWFILGCQSYCKADRLRKLGWNSHRPALLDIFEEEFNAFDLITVSKGRTYLIIDGVTEELMCFM